MRKLLIAPLLLLAAPAAHAAVLWRGDFSTGNLSQWTSPQSASPNGQSWDPSRLTVVQNPHPPDSPAALQVTLNAGDIAYNYNHKPPVFMGSRSEVTHPPQLKEGDERWYRWEVFIPSDYAVSDGKGGGAVITQWHHYSASRGEPGSPPLLICALTNELQLVHVSNVNSQTSQVLWSTPIVKNQWHTFIFHVRFSSNAGTGLAELWYDGQHVAQAATNTLFPGFTDYLKMGLYRRPNATPGSVIYLANMVEATAQTDVM